MSDPQFVNGWLIGVGATMGCYLVVRVYMILDLYFKHKKQVQDFPNIKPLDESTVCKGPHEWHNTILAFIKIPMKKYKVCTKCGFVSGENFQLNNAAIMAVSEAQEVKDLRIKRITELSEKIESELLLAKFKFVDESLVTLLSIINNPKTDSKQLKTFLDISFDASVLLQFQITQDLKRKYDETNGFN